MKCAHSKAGVESDINIPAESSVAAVRCTRRSGETHDTRCTMLHMQARRESRTIVMKGHGRRHPCV